MSTIKIKKDYDELINTYSDMYESSVCKERQLPDYNDGMRIVQRRIFWVFLNRSKENQYKLAKSATIVGDTIKLHPHGDSSLYGSLVNEVNSVSNLLKGKGNWGDTCTSIKSKPAAMRYTECALNKEASQYFKYAKLCNIVIGEVGYEEPEYIPVPFPYSLISGFFGISKAGRCQIPSYKINDLYRRLRYLLGLEKEVVIIKPYFGNEFKMDGDFESILKTGKGQVTVYPNLLIQHKKQEIIVKGVCPIISNLGTILEKMSVDKKYGRYINIKDLSSKTTDIRITFNTKYMKNVEITFNQLVEFVKKKLTVSISYNIIAYKGYKNYPIISVDQWILDNYNRIITYRDKELSILINKENQKLLLNQAILKIRPLIQSWLNQYKVFTKSIINNLKREVQNILGDKELTSKVMQISITNLLNADIDTTIYKKEINRLKKLNNKEKHSEYILKWMEEL